METKIAQLRQMLLDKDYPLGLDELLGQIEWLYEDDAEVSKVIQTYIDDFYKMFSCAQKFYKVKDLVDEEFYTEIEF